MSHQNFEAYLQGMRIAKAPSGEAVIQVDITIENGNSKIYETEEIPLDSHFGDYDESKLPLIMLLVEIRTKVNPINTKEDIEDIEQSIDTLLESLKND